MKKTHKKCGSCKTTKETTEFSKASGRYDGLQSHCKDCRSTRRKKDYLKNKEHELELVKAWAKDNPDAVKSKARKYAQSDKGSAYYNSRSSERRSNKKDATPKWLTDAHRDGMKSLYLLAKKLEKLCNVKYHVDHIVPLNGTDVSGLHTPWNLQIMEASLNIRKSNKHDPKDNSRGLT